MENELNFYKGICEEQTKKLGQLQEAFDEIKEKLKEKEEDNKKLKEENDKYKLEREALLMKITSLNKKL